MTTQTREQAFDQWFAERYPDTTSVYSEFKSTTVRDLMREAMSAGRDQGLREAKEVCERLVPKQGTTGRVFAVGECAAAIEQLRGK